MDINNLYISQNNPTLPRTYVSTSTKGKSGEYELVFTLYVSLTGKTVVAELKAYEGYKIIAHCSIRKRASPYLNTAARESAKTILEIAGFSEVSSDTIQEIDYRQARAFVQQLLEQLSGNNTYLNTVEVIHNWRLS